MVAEGLEEILLPLDDPEGRLLNFPFHSVCHLLCFIFNISSITVLHIPVVFLFIKCDSFPIL